jgi:hypothetical protein
MMRFLTAAILLAPALALAARYDPGADRVALRQAATLCYSTVVDASGLALEPEKAKAISAGLDERLRWRRLASGQEALKKNFEGLAEPDKKEAKPLLDKASVALRTAEDALRPLEESLKVMNELKPELDSSRAGSKWLLVEISSVADATTVRARSRAPRREPAPGKSWISCAGSRAGSSTRPTGPAIAPTSSGGFPPASRSPSAPSRRPASPRPPAWPAPRRS